jgi:hypothetical protein
LRAFTLCPFARVKEFLMPWSTPIPVIVWTLILIVLGVLFWRSKPRSILATLVIWLDFLAINLLFFFTLNWSIVNYYLRYLCLIIPAAVLIRSILSMSHLPWLPQKELRAWRAAFLIGLILVPLFGYANMRVLASNRFRSGEPVPLLVLIPVYGMWVVTNGGNAADGIGMSNYANALFPADTYTDPSMAYAVDFQEITIRGNLSESGSQPSDFRVYEGFNKEVFAPCKGTVVFVESSLPDVEVGTPVNSLGNRVVLKCFEVYVTVSSLRNILVKVDDDVHVGQTLGYLGNSGSPSMPHLHIHAATGSYGPDGTPVPLLFEYKFMTRNHVFITRP